MKSSRLRSLALVVVVVAFGGLLALCAQTPAPVAPSGAAKPGAPAASQPAPVQPAAVQPALGQPAASKPPLVAEKDPSKEIAKPVVASKPANDPKAREVINRYLDAIGGLKVLEAVDDRTFKFRVTKHTATGETVAAMNQFLKKGYKVREEWDIQGMQIKDKPLAFVQVYNGSEGWVQMFGTVSPLEGKTLSLFVWDKLLDDFFCHWEADGYTVKHLGAASVDNDPSEVVQLTDFGGSSTKKYYFSTKSGLLVKLEWFEDGPAGKSKKETFFKKYRKVPFSDKSGNAAQFATLQEIFDDGDLDTTREYFDLGVNTGLKDGIFDRPEGEEFKGAIGGGGSQPVPVGAGPKVNPPIAIPLGGQPNLGAKKVVPAPTAVPPGAGPAGGAAKSEPAKPPTPPAPSPEKKQ